MDRVYSAPHLDNQSVYHSDAEDDIPATEDEKGIDPALEVRDGVVNEQDTDLEKGKASRTPLERSQTARSGRSAQDPKLVFFSLPVSSAHVA